MILTLTYVVKVITLSDLQMVLVGARSSFKSYNKNNVLFLLYTILKTILYPSLRNDFLYKAILIPPLPPPRFNNNGKNNVFIFTIRQRGK